jgi:hypothetical protein
MVFWGSKALLRVVELGQFTVFANRFDRIQLRTSLIVFEGTTVSVTGGRGIGLLSLTATRG